MTALVVLSGCGSTARSAAGPSRGPTAASSFPPGVDALTYTALQNLESALGEQGRGPFRSVFGSLELDAQAGKVRVYATDEAKAHDLIAAAVASRPGIEAERAEVVKCRYARVDVDPVIEKIGDAAQADTLPVPVFAVRMAPGAAGVQVQTTKEGVASRELRAALEGLAGSVPVTLLEGGEIHGLDGTNLPAPSTAAASAQ
ncbi:hypothetical protein ACFY00_17770 [Kitasatospora sp. NPDC001540]|uniref:hypothetical protein n=1 Tax=Kitasatospora sp. NPDC001540 TaxID=3364014 RepID=UPI0036A963A5